MDTSEERLAAIEAEYRKKYNTAEREKLAKEGKALPDGSYPIVDKEDLTNAATLAASGHGDVDAAKALIRKRAKELGVDVESLPGFGKESKSADPEAEERAQCPTCKGSGKIMDGNRECPDCHGSGKAPEQQNTASTVTVVRRRKERHRSVPLMPEVRHWGMQPTSVEIRSAKDTDEAIVTGSPIVYLADYTVYDMFGEFTERMARGVASELLKRGVDTRFLFNHDDMPLARTTSGTMTLQDGERSLDFEARLDMRQQCANDLVIAIGRGDVTQMSCRFMVGRDEWDDAMEDRTIYQLADLLDVSAVTYPASPTTSIEVAQRMLSMAPIESRARLRNFLVAERAGKTLSGASNSKVVSAIEALHGLYEAGGGNPADLIEDDGSSESESNETALAQDGTGGEDGEPIRSSALALRLQLEARSKKRKRLAA